MDDSSSLLTIPISEEFWSFDTIATFDSLGKQSYLLCGKDGAQIKLSGSAHFLLKSVRSGISFSELSEMLNSRECEQKVTKEELQSKYNALLAQLHDIEMQSSRQKGPWGFWMRIPLVSEERVGKISSVTSIFYHPLAVGCTLALLVGCISAALYRGFEFTASSVSVLPGFILFLITLIAHEFGHASACWRFGAKPSDIGFTFYLVYPAFYSDVSSAWKLSRGQRLIVDLGGCYFQAIVTALFLLLFYSTGWEPLHTAIIISLYSALSSLNPIFKFDGYWVAADLLGVSNLSTQPQRIYRYVLDRLRGRSAERLPWPPALTAVLIGYSGLAIGVWGFFVMHLIPMLRVQVMMASHAGGLIGGRLLAGRLPIWQDIARLFFSCVFLFLVVITLWNIVKALFRVALKWATRIAGHLRGQSSRYPASLPRNL